MNEQELARREAELREKEAELARREQEVRASEQAQSAAAQEEAQGSAPENAPAAPRRPIEGLYDHIHIPLWMLDTIIAGCIIAFFVVVAVGALKGRGML